MFIIKRHLTFNNITICSKIYRNKLFLQNKNIILEDGRKEGSIDDDSYLGQTKISTRLANR